MRIIIKKRLFSLYQITSNLEFQGGILLIFLISNNLDIGEASLLFAISLVSKIFFELPLGILSDYIGDKKVILIGLNSLSIYGFLLLIGDSMILYMLAFFIQGIGLACTSGADDSFAFKVVISGQQELLSEYRAKYTSYSFMALAGSCIFGGLIAEYYNLDVVIILYILSNILAIIFIASIREDKSKNTLNNTSLIDIPTFLVSQKSDVIIPIVLVALIEASLSIYFVNSQKILDNYFGDLFLVAASIACFEVASFFGARLSSKSYFTGNLKTHSVIIFLITLFTFFINNYYFIVIFFVLVSFVTSIKIAFENYLIRSVDKNLTSTALSFFSLITAIISSIGFLIIYLIDKHFDNANYIVILLLSFFSVITSTVILRQRDDL